MDLARVAAEGAAAGHNYPRALVGTSDCDERGVNSPQEKRLRAHGRFWAIDRTRVGVGRGRAAYARAVRALRTWEHFDLGWAGVERDSGTEAGARVCVRARAGPVWTVNPLEVVRLRADDSGKKGLGVKERFVFAHGTLGGHLLAGEERFSVEMASDGEVFYEAYAFSRPAHALSVLGYPVVRLMQKKFHRDSSEAMRRIVREASERK